MNSHNIAFLQNIRGQELILIFLIVLLLFGAKRLPELFRSFGNSIREFKKATSGIEDDIRSAMDVETDKTHQTKHDTKKEADSDAASKSTASDS